MQTDKIHSPHPSSIVKGTDNITITKGINLKGITITRKYFRIRQKDYGGEIKETKGKETQQIKEIIATSLELKKFQNDMFFKSAKYIIQKV